MCLALEEEAMGGGDETHPQIEKVDSDTHPIFDENIFNGSTNDFRLLLMK